MSRTQTHWTTMAEDGKTLIVQHENRQAIAGALLRGEGCEAMDKGGRGAVLRFPLDGGAGIVRICRRGGVIRHLIKDAYLFVNRPLREWQVHTFLYENNATVSEPLGVCWQRRGVRFSGSLATREIPNAQTLLDFLSAPGEARNAQLANVGILVRQMHDLGVVHGDLQVGNILMTAEQPYLIDFGNSRHKPRLSDTRRTQDLLRFRRSLLKNGLSLDWYERFCEGYGTFTPSTGLDWGYRLKAALSDLTFGRRPRGGGA